MGGSLGKAELALLDHGVRWWSDQGGAPVSYTTLDVPLHDGDGIGNTNSGRSVSHIITKFDTGSEGMWIKSIYGLFVSSCIS